MTIDKSLKTKKSMAGQRNVLSRAERILKLKDLGRWDDSEMDPLGLPKVRVYKLILKKKKKVEKKEDDKKKKKK